MFPKEMLFNLKEDPYEQNDIAKENPDLCLKAFGILNNWKDEIMDKRNIDRDPLWTVMKEGGPFHAKGRLDYYCERLENTDRGWAVPELKEKHWREKLNKQGTHRFGNTVLKLPNENLKESLRNQMKRSDSFVFKLTIISMPLIYKWI